MCHEIRSKHEYENASTKYYLHGKIKDTTYYFLGLKALNMSGKDVYAPIAGCKYKINKCEVGYRFDNGEDTTISEQEVTFFVPRLIFEDSNTFIGVYPIYRKAKTGMHIFPPVRSAIKNNIFPYEFFVTREMPFGHKDIFPVIFKHTDIIFFDGEDVSVSKFYVCSVRTLYKMFGKDVLKKLDVDNFVINNTRRLYKFLRRK